MKTLKLTSALIVAISINSSSTLRAQTADIKLKDIPANANEETTISIKKGPTATTPAPATTAKVKYEIISEQEDLEGDDFYNLKDALQSWKLACDEWKKEFREQNKENKILYISCGNKQKVREEGKFQYRSKASYKIKVKVEEEV